MYDAYLVGCVTSCTASLACRPDGRSVQVVGLECPCLDFVCMARFLASSTALNVPSQKGDPAAAPSFFGRTCEPWSKTHPALVTRFYMIPIFTDVITP